MWKSEEASRCGSAPNFVTLGGFLKFPNHQFPIYEMLELDQNWMISNADFRSSTLQTGYEATSIQQYPVLFNLSAAKSVSQISSNKVHFFFSNCPAFLHNSMQSFAIDMSIFLSIIQFPEYSFSNLRVEKNCIITKMDSDFIYKVHFGPY